MTDLPELAAVRRNGVIESRHFGSLIALGSDGQVAVSLGDPDGLVLPRSTVKPAQALAALTAGAPLAGPRLAIAAGSHTGEDEHVRVVREILGAAGLDDSALGCVPDWPEDTETRERLIRAHDHQVPIRMNCSGKHAAMLLAAAVNGWDTASYLDLEHPLQQHTRATVAGLTGVAVGADAVDGCGAPLFGTSVRGLARMFRRLVTAQPGTPEHAVAQAMRQHPYYVGGSGHQNSLAMTLVPGALAKGGAEGVIGMAAATGQAVAMKIVDGSPRATTMIALEVLAALGVDVSAAGQLRDLPVLGGGHRVGEIIPGEGLLAALAGLPVRS
ncbi:MAG TPA: asparaginase [Trebonia sp.]|nr:asparaginase [Trebonia sp.]